LCPIIIVVSVAVKSKDRQYNGQKIKNDLQSTTQKAKDLATRNPTNNVLRSGKQFLLRMCFWSIIASQPLIRKIPTSTISIWEWEWSIRSFFIFWPLYCLSFDFTATDCTFVTYRLYREFMFYYSPILRGVCFVLPVCCIMLLVPDGIIRPVVSVGTRHAH
jgi:hypothetical protein